MIVKQKVHTGLTMDHFYNLLYLLILIILIKDILSPIIGK
jgi:hypothetical protein